MRTEELPTYLTKRARRRPMMKERQHSGHDIWLSEFSDLSCNATEIDHITPTLKLWV